jgi:hypothetical protein
MLQELFILQRQENPNLLRGAAFQQDGAPPHFIRNVSVFKPNLAKC